MLCEGKGADIKRCHQLRGALALLDFEDETSIGDLRGLLLRAAFSPPFLRLSEGRRMLSSLFSLQVCCNSSILISEFASKKTIPGSRQCFEGLKVFTKDVYMHFLWDISTVR